MISHFIAGVDQALLTFSKWRARNVDEERFDELSMKARHASRGEIYFAFLVAVDAKSQALLTHISIMIAFSIVLFESIKSNVILKYLVGIEALAYVLLACLCLRIIRVLSPRLAVRTPKDYQSALKAEVVFRRELYEVALNLVMIVTVLFAVTFALNVFL